MTLPFCTPSLSSLDPGSCLSLRPPAFKVILCLHLRTSPGVYWTKWTWSPLLDYGPGPETQEFHAQILKLASEPEWILPDALHVSKSSGQTMLLCIPPGRRIGREAAVCRMFRRPLDLQVGVSTHVPEPLCGLQ